MKTKNKPSSPTHTKKTNGFTLMELMIVILIVAVLTVIAVAVYQKNIAKAKYLNVISAADPYISAVAACIQHLGVLTGCNTGTYGIPPAISTTPISNAPNKYVGSLTVANGVITVTPTAIEGIVVTDTYILTPTIQPSGATTAGNITGVSWSNSTSGCIASGLCNTATST